MAKPSRLPEKKMAHPAKDEPKMKKAPHSPSNNLGKWLHPKKAEAKPTRASAGKTR